MQLISPEDHIHNLNTQWRLSADDEHAFIEKQAKTMTEKNILGSFFSEN